MEVLSADLIENYLPIINKITFGTTLDAKFKIVLSIGLFVEKEVTLARAAQLADKSIQDFIEILKLKGISWEDYTTEHFNLDNIGINKYVEAEKNN